MKAQNHRWLRLAAIALAVQVGVLACSRQQETVLTPIRVGWQIPLATQGQVVQVLKRTDLLESSGLRGVFVPFSYGGPQTEAALAGELDVIFVGDQPAINLIARGGKWKIVSRLFYTKTAIMVPLDSPIRVVADLRGKTLASPFGSVAHREAILRERAGGLDPDKDVQNVNLDILEISNVVQAGGTKSWGKLDAVAVWEPSTSLFELKKMARVVDFTRTLGVVAISDEFLAKNREASVRFLAATVDAWAYFAANTDAVNQWYVADARLPYTPDVLDSAARVEPNYGARSFKDVDLRITADHVSTLNAGAAWAHERGFTKVKVEMAPFIDTSLLGQAVLRAGKLGHPR